MDNSEPIEQKEEFPLEVGSHVYILGDSTTDKRGRLGGVRIIGFPQKCVG